MYRDVSSCNTYNYGDALYWNARYVQEGGSFDWYQRYSALRPFVRKYIPTSSRVLMVGCGNARNFSSTPYLFFCFFYFVFVVPFFNLFLLISLFVWSRLLFFFLLKIIYLNCFPLLSCLIAKKTRENGEELEFACDCEFSSESLGFELIRPLDSCKSGISHLRCYLIIG